jgi:hypothetical protein
MSGANEPSTVDDVMRARLVEISKTPFDANLDNASHDFAVLARAVLSILDRLDKEVIGRG